MAKTWTDAQKLAPKDADVQAFTDPGGAIMTVAYSFLNQDSWARNNGTDLSLFDLAAEYIGLHIFTVGGKTGGSGGPTSQEKVGDVARSMEVVVKDPQWDSTPYGRMYLALQRRLGIDSRFMVTGGSNFVPPSFLPPFIP